MIFLWKDGAHVVWHLNIKLFRYSCQISTCQNPKRKTVPYWLNVTCCVNCITLPGKSKHAFKDRQHWLTLVKLISRTRAINHQWYKRSTPQQATYGRLLMVVCCNTDQWQSWMQLIGWPRRKVMSNGNSTFSVGHVSPMKGATSKSCK